MYVYITLEELPYIHTYMHTNVMSYTYIHIHLKNYHTYMHTNVMSYTYIHIYIHTNQFLYTHTYSTYIHTYCLHSTYQVTIFQCGKLLKILEEHENRQIRPLLSHEAVSDDGQAGQDGHVGVAHRYRQHFADIAALFQHVVDEGPDLAHDIYIHTYIHTYRYVLKSVLISTTIHTYIHIYISAVVKIVITNFYAFVYVCTYCMYTLMSGACMYVLRKYDY